jgi:hypothetical protein
MENHLEIWRPKLDDVVGDYVVLPCNLDSQGLRI